MRKTDKNLTIAQILPVEYVPSRSLDEAFFSWEIRYEPVRHGLFSSSILYTFFTEIKIAINFCCNFFDWLVSTTGINSNMTVQGLWGSLRWGVWILLYEDNPSQSRWQPVLPCSHIIYRWLYHIVYMGPKVLIFTWTEFLVLRWWNRFSHGLFQLGIIKLI